MVRNIQIADAANGPSLWLGGKVARAALELTTRGRLSVLIFHRVLPKADELLPDEPTATQFEKLMRWVQKLFNVIPLAEGIEGIKSNKLPSRALAITFDDGYANNATIAAPILTRLGLPATFFIATAYLDGGRMFNDTVIEAVRQCTDSELDLVGLGLETYPLRTTQEKRAAIAGILRSLKYRPVEERTQTAESIALRTVATLPNDLMMSSEQAAALGRGGHTVGGHTARHPILTTLSDQDATSEITDGRRRLEEIAECRVSLFAYPNGRPGVDYDRRHVALVRELGFAGAVSTSPGAARTNSNPYEIPRFTPWTRRPHRFTALMAANASIGKPNYAELT
jgi:peptidoglycan/xylan/chitin deacetylase (PgdA/CDA1 family)